MRLAGAAGAGTVDLTSRPSRRAANALDERLGFEARDSTVYRLAGPELTERRSERPDGTGRRGDGTGGRGR